MGGRGGRRQGGGRSRLEQLELNWGAVGAGGALGSQGVGSILERVCLGCLWPSEADVSTVFLSKAGERVVT